LSNADAIEAPVLLGMGQDKDVITGKRRHSQAIIQTEAPALQGLPDRYPCSPGLAGCNQTLIWYNNGEFPMMTALNQTQSLEHKAETLYEQYGKPLEKTHKGDYIAIAEDGKTIIGESALEVMQEAKKRLGPGNFIFKLGERSIGKWL